MGLYLHMYQPLDKFNPPQAIDVFAARGLTTDVVLAQLVIKAITVLENCGLKIHGVVSDGAAPNHKFWSEMGVCGKKKF